MYSASASRPKLNSMLGLVRDSEKGKLFVTVMRMTSYLGYHISDNGTDAEHLFWLTAPWKNGRQDDSDCTQVEADCVRVHFLASADHDCPAVRDVYQTFFLPRYIPTRVQVLNVPLNAKLHKRSTRSSVHPFIDRNCDF